MKVVATMDGDGHFQVAALSDREKAMTVLEACDEGGDYIEDIVDGLEPYEQEIWENWKIISQEAWERVICHFEQRGTFEIIEI